MRSLYIFLLVSFLQQIISRHSFNTLEPSDANTFSLADMLFLSSLIRTIKVTEMWLVHVGCATESQNILSWKGIAKSNPWLPTGQLKSQNHRDWKEPLEII